MYVMFRLFNFEAFEGATWEKQDDEEPPTCTIHYENLEGSFEYELVPHVSVNDHQVRDTKSAAHANYDKEKSLKPSEYDVPTEKGPTSIKVLPSPDPDLVSGSIR